MSTDEDQMWVPRPIIVPSGPSIFVIGPDMVGKTTICKVMGELTGIPVWKFPSEKEIFKSSSGAGSLVFDRALPLLLEQTGYRIISDRCYACEWVYSQVFGRPTDRSMLTAIDAEHAMIGTKILYLYSSVTPVQPDDIVPQDRYHDIRRKYDEFADWTGCDIVPFNTKEMLDTYQSGGDSSHVVALECLKLLGEIE